MSKVARAARPETVGVAPFFEKCFRYEDATRVRQTGYYSFFRVIESAQDPEVVHDGRRLVMMGSNNYLGLTNDPRVKEAAIEAIRKYGSGCAGSRFLNGTLDLHVRLEERLAEFMRQEAAVTFSTGFQVNLGAIACLVSKGDTVYLDKQDHACIIDGARLSFGEVKKFKHNDPGDLRRQMRNDNEARGRLVVVDGVFSMEGDISPLPEIVSVAREFAAGVMVDDAHGIGVLGGGRGSSFSENSYIAVPLQMGTLSKAIGSYGGYLCASAPVVELMRNRARTLIYSTGLPPASVAAAIAALDLIEREPAYAALPVAKAKAFTRRAGLLEAQSPIVPIVIGDEEEALSASRALEDEGFLVVAIRPPTVPPGTARLRLTFTAQHPDDEIERLADIVRDRLSA